MVLIAVAAAVLAVSVASARFLSWRHRRDVLARVRAEWGRPQDRPRNMAAIAEYHLSLRRMARLVTVLLAAAASLAVTAGLKNAFALEPLGDSVRRAGPAFWGAWFVMLSLLLIISLIRGTAAASWVLFGALMWIILFGASINLAVLMLSVTAVAEIAASSKPRSAGSRALWFTLGLSAQLVIMDVVQHLLHHGFGAQTTSSPAEVFSRWVVGLLLLFIGATSITRNRRRLTRSVAGSRRSTP